MLCDKMAVLQVIGNISKNPLLLADRECTLNVDDFPEQFHKIVFGAIEHLAADGAKRIDAIDIDQFLAPYTGQYKVFCDNRGVEYVEKCQNVAEEENYKYYFNTLKKYSLVNKLKAQGFNIKEIYDETLTDPRDIQAMLDKFNGYTLNDILNIYTTKLIFLKEAFGKSENIRETKAGDFLEELLYKFKETPDVGLSLVSPKLTTIYRGRRLGKFYIESAASGVGKTRRMCGEACKIAVPWFYDLKKKKWLENYGAMEPTLYISTEVPPEECETLFGAYIAGVPEELITEGTATEEQFKRCLKAVKYLRSTNLHFVQMTDFDVEDVENVIRKYNYLYGVRYVFFDYLSTSPKVLSEGAKNTRMSTLREDQVLLMFAQRMKDLSTLLDIHIQTATQLNGDWKNAREADQNLLRGAKSIADKTDAGAILMPVREWDKQIIESWRARPESGFAPQPNMVVHVYKVRRTKFNNIRVYVNFDRATCRLEDCFCTTYDGEIVDIKNTNVDAILDQTACDKILCVDREIEAMEEEENRFSF